MISPPVVLSLALLMKRSAKDQVSHAIHLLMSLCKKITVPEETQMTVSELVDKGYRIAKLFERSARDNKEASIFRHICTFKCALRIDEFWHILKSHCSGHNSMITKEITVQQLKEKIAEPA